LPGAAFFGLWSAQFLFFFIPQKFGHLPVNHPSDQLSWRTPLAIVISLNRTLSFKKRATEAHDAPEFARGAPEPTWCRPVAQPLLAVLFGVNKGKTCSPQPAIAIAFPCLRTIPFSVALCLCGKSRRLFSSTYELPFPQLSCFQKHLRCPLLFPNLNIQRTTSMTQQAANSHFINNPARCTHRYPNGRRCRLSASLAHPNFCLTHARLPQNQPEPEIASVLIANLTDFTSASQINDFLSRLLLLLAQDKISTRRAAVLAYITNQLLRTLPAIAKEENSGETTIIFDMPGPDRDRPAPEHPGDLSATAGGRPGTQNEVIAEKVPA
jgi:hypothetical protein